MMCKIVRFQKLIWRNILRLTKSKKSFGFILLYKYKYIYIFIDIFIDIDIRYIDLMQL